MTKYDRLSALISRFTLSVTPVEPALANLLILSHHKNQQPARVLLSPLNTMPISGIEREQILFSALTEWGGHDNPLFSALPEIIELDIDESDDTAKLISLLMVESDAQRCGCGTVLNRLGEVLIVRLLRAQIERGTTGTGLLGGLADARLSRCIVAIHEEPGKTWRNDELAHIAGLSLSRFAELFLELVGETPQAYLRRWRMTLARQDVEQGVRIQTVARRYGYGSSEALSRAFRRQFGDKPIALRRSSQN